MRKTLQELTIKNNFMFAAVMLQEDHCRHFLEMLLGITISNITINSEKTIVYNPEYKGVRLDIEAEDEAHTHYDIEIQVSRKETLLRSRYYHSQMDMDLLVAGATYEELPASYVIFICDYDPLGCGKYCYTLRQTCQEVPQLDVSAGLYTIFLSTKGTNDDEVSKELVQFLKYIGAESKNSNDDFGDSYVERLQETVRKIKRNREMGERYMVFEEMLRDEREEGRKEGRKEELLQTVYSILELKNIILLEKEQELLHQEKDLDLLRKLVGLAAMADSEETFHKGFAALK